MFQEFRAGKNTGIPIYENTRLHNVALFNTGVGLQPFVRRRPTCFKTVAELLGNLIKQYIREVHYFYMLDEKHGLEYDRMSLQNWFLKTVIFFPSE